MIVDLFRINKTVLCSIGLIKIYATLNTLLTFSNDQYLWKICIEKYDRTICSGHGSKGVVHRVPQGTLMGDIWDPNNF